MDPHIDILQRVREACAHGCFEVSYITNKELLSTHAARLTREPCGVCNRACMSR